MVNLFFPLEAINTASSHFLQLKSAMPFSCPLSEICKLKPISPNSESKNA